MSIKDLIKQLLPPYLLKKAIGLFYGWNGDYKSWKEAESKSDGYDSSKIIEKILSASLKVKNGTFPYERDSVNFEKVIYSFPLFSTMLLVAIEKSNKINVLDFGGSLGSSYFQNIMALSLLESFQWCIVEQPKLVTIGKQYFENEHLHFYYSIDDCIANYKVDLVILSGVIQYLKNPTEFLNDLIKRKFKYIFFDRTLFSTVNKDILTIQKVPKKIYPAKYPCWFLCENEFLNRFRSTYEIIFEFDNYEYINFPSKMKGFLFKKKQ